MTNGTAESRYDATTIALHWLIAGLIVFQWLGAHAIDWFPKGPWRVDARSIHITVGAAVTLLLLARIWWRLTGGRRLPPVNHGPLQLIARTMHFALYIVIAVIVSLGLFTTWIRGDSLFGIVSIPHFGTYLPDARHQLADEIAGWHQTAANVVLILAGGHMAAAIGHALLHRNGALLRRIGLPIASRGSRL